MKKIVALMVGLTTLAFSLSAQDREHTLKVYNWADYIDEALIPEFEKWYQEQTGESVKIIYQLFDVNEIMLSKIERGHEDYDVVCPSDYIIEKIRLAKGKEEGKQFTCHYSALHKATIKEIEAMGIKVDMLGNHGYRFHYPTKRSKAWYRLNMYGKNAIGTNGKFVKKTA